MKILNLKILMGWLVLTCGCRSFIDREQASDIHLAACQLYSVGTDDAIKEAIGKWNLVYRNYDFYQNASSLEADYAFKMKVAMNLASACYELGERLRDKELVYFSLKILRFSFECEYHQACERMGITRETREDGEEVDHLNLEMAKKSDLFSTMPAVDRISGDDYMLPIPFGIVRGVLTIAFSPGNMSRPFVVDHPGDCLGIAVACSFISVVEDWIQGSIDVLTLGASGNSHYINGKTPWFWERDNSDCFMNYLNRSLDARINRGL